MGSEMSSMSSRSMRSSSLSSSSPSINDFNFEGDNFKIGGPLYLTSMLAWEEMSFQRAVAACLVNAVYVHLADCELKRQESEKLAPAWWRVFGFELWETLYDDGGVPFAAVFENQLISSHPDHAPKVVIAVRGLGHKNDFGTCVDSFLFSTSQCFKKLLKHVALYAEEHCKKTGEVWLCGHSLGATIASGVGARMKPGHRVKTFLFNPPYVLDPMIDRSIVLDSIKFPQLIMKLAEATENESVISITTLISSVVGVLLKGLVICLLSSNRRDLSGMNVDDSWCRRVYVSPFDRFSKQYIPYFAHGRTAGNPLNNDNNNNNNNNNAPISAAVLVCSVNGNSGLKESHQIAQWWRQELVVESTYYPLTEPPAVLNDERPLLLVSSRTHNRTTSDGHHREPDRSNYRWWFIFFSAVVALLCIVVALVSATTGGYYWPWVVWWFLSISLSVGFGFLLNRYGFLFLEPARQAWIQYYGRG